MNRQPRDFSHLCEYLSVKQEPLISKFTTDTGRLIGGFPMHTVITSVSIIGNITINSNTDLKTKLTLE